MECEFYFMKSEFGKNFFNLDYWEQKHVWQTHYKRFLKGEITREELDTSPIRCLNPHWLKMWEEW